MKSRIHGVLWFDQRKMSAQDRLGQEAAAGETTAWKVGLGNNQTDGTDPSGMEVIASSQSRPMGSKN